jgi:hypothetical protein
MVEQPSPVPPLGNTPGATPGPSTVAPDPVQLAGQRALREGQRLARAGHVLVPVTITRARDGKKNAKFHIGWRAGGTSRADVLRDWSVQHPGASFAILCGPSGVEVLDLDAAEGGPAWWAEQGMPASRYVVDTPGGGEHHYWRRRPGAEADDRLVNNAGKVAPGVDARTVGGLVFAPGSFVLDPDGIPEPRAYTARSELPGPDALEETPRAVLGLWSRARAARPRAELVPGQVNQDRRFTPLEAHAYVASEAMEPLLAAEYGHNVNDTLNRAALVLGHFVPTFWSADDAHDALGAWLLAGPGKRNGWTALDREDIDSINSGLRRGMAEPYTLRVGPGSNALPEINGEVDPVDLLAGTKTALPGATSMNAAGLVPGVDLDMAVARLRVRREAERVVNAEQRPPLRRVAVSEFLASPQPTYLVPGLLYRDSLAVVFGPPGTAKTFLMLDLSLCLATGRAWRGETLLPRTRVHYVMAEGQAVNVGRTLAWLTHHGIDPAELEGWFDPWPEAITLTPDGVGNYLEAVQADQPGLIVLDTKHAMMDGDESRPADLKVLRDALEVIRGGSNASVVLVDHSGLGDVGRARGSNAQKGMVQGEIKMSTIAGVHTAEITRDKAGQEGASWSFRLQPVPTAPHAVGTAVPVVAVPVSRAAQEKALRDDCWTVPRTELPNEVATMTGSAGEAACDIYRVLHSIKDHDGLTTTQIEGLLKESPRAHSRATVFKAVRMLDAARVLEHSHNGRSWVLTMPFMSPEKSE